jgi:N-acetylglucosaminyldiphosphoundecaprenol N-acetyl-beta-D-mannosaminyltransferase
MNTAHAPRLEAEQGHRKLVMVGGLPFDRMSTDEAVSQICSAIVQRQPLFVSTPNLSFVMAAQTSQEFRQSVFSSDLSLADGTPIMWLARRQGTPLPERVAGADLFDAIRFGAGQRELGRPVRVFFFGGPEGVAQRACDVLNAELESGKGHMQGVGAHYPGHGSVEEMSSHEVISQINASGADFLVVALGARKGQAWLMHNRHRITVPVISHLGAVVNFVAGTVRRAPRFLRKMGMEWLWRIKEEPALFDRYWNDGKGLIQLWFAHDRAGR